jgi:hypothetical protein
MHTISTDSLLARVAHLPADVVVLIYKHFVQGLLKRVAAKNNPEQVVLYGSGSRERI